MKSVALHNLGCKVNGYETDVMQQMLQENGYKIVPFDEKADIYIINTCSVTNIADRKSRQMLHRAKKRNPAAVVVATGCYVQTGTEKILADMGIDLAIGNNKKKDLVSILEAYFAEREEDRDKTLHGKTLTDIAHAAEYESMLLKTTAGHTRAFIKIQDGCNQFCSYCIIPYARGRSRSRAEEEILKEVEGLAKEGFKEVVLTGIHLSSYGLDRDGIRNIPAGEDFPGERLLSLIRKISKIEGIARIRLGSLEPRIITERFIAGLAEIPGICPHFHLSLQSGSDSVLQRMNRRYTTKEYAARVEILRKYFEDPAVTTDVIVGFPGETEQEFKETETFLAKIKFAEMHIFKYSKREGTVAAARKDQITEGLKEERSDRLIALSERMNREYRQAHIGRKLSVLFEEEKEADGRLLLAGYSREYIYVAVEKNSLQAGQIADIEFSEEIR